MAVFKVGDSPADPKVIHVKIRHEVKDVRGIMDKKAALVKIQGTKFAAVD